MTDKSKLTRHSAYWTCCGDPDVGPMYYFAPTNRAPGSYTTQREVKAIIDVADDGTLAGVELIDEMPPPPSHSACDCNCEEPAPEVEKETKP